MQNKLPPHGCLLVVLKPRLTLARSASWPLKNFTLDEKRYVDAGYGEWTGFYDWLRDSEKRLIGVRYWPNEDGNLFLDKIRKLSYAQEGPVKSIEIYFGNNRNAHEKFSSDQDLVYDAVFLAEDGELAIAFEMGSLAESDQGSLGGAEADWKDFRSA